MAVPYALTVDGFESQIGTNHLGHFALTNLLLPKLTDRVVTVSSMMHLIGYLSIKDLNWKSRPYLAWPAYGQSKLANLLFTSELQRRLAAAGSPVKALAAHPGYSATNLQGHTGNRFGSRIWDAGNQLFATDADFGARQTLYAVSQDLPGDSFIGPRFVDAGPDRSALAQPAGPRPREGRGAVGTVRAAHRDRISALAIFVAGARCATLATRHGEGGLPAGHRYRREPASEVRATLAVPDTDHRLQEHRTWRRTPPTI